MPRKKERARVGILATVTRRSRDGQSVRACCVLCGCESARSLDVETEVAQVRAPAKIVRCVGCGFRYLWPRPSDAVVRSAYSEESVARYCEAGMRYVGGETEVPCYLRVRLAYLKRQLGGVGKLLDVGAGSGAFARFAAESGWEVVATELETAASRIAAQGGVEVIVGDLTEIELPHQEAFDVVHMNHVLEHVCDPVRTLRRAREVLRPRGLLVVEVPHEFADLAFLVRRAVHASVAYRVPTQHLWFFTPRTLQRMVRGAGFQIVRLSTRREWSDAQAWRRLTKRAVGWLERLVGRGPLIELIANRQGPGA